MAALHEIALGTTDATVDPTTGAKLLLSDTVRESRFVDFKTGVLLSVSPMDLTALLTANSRVNEKIQVFECRMEVWTLGQAIQLLRLIETNQPPSLWCHAAFALVTLISNYFEIIGKILNPKARGWKESDKDVNFGFHDVYSCSSDLMVDTVRDRMRNGTYHLGFPKAGFWIAHDPSGSHGDFYLSRETDDGPIECLMDPYRVTCTIVNHFKPFLDRLYTASSSQDDPLTKGFLKFFDAFPTQYGTKEAKPPSA